MKQLILKELREQFKVALIGLIILTLMLLLAFAIYGSQLQRVVMIGQANSDSLQPLLSIALLIQVSFFCAIFGTLLGWLQIRTEKHPDLWAFLVHRPIHRTNILRSKVLAGWLLYLAGAGLPLLGFVLVVAIPGKVAAPFAWAMALPLTSIFLVGMVYYFAGLLTGLRKARWFASRGFGLGLAVTANISLSVVPEFWQALLIIAASGTLLAVAVWGSFQTGGFYRDQPVAGKVALALASTVSILLVLGLLCSFAVTMVSLRGDYTFSRYQLTPKGNILRVTQRGDGGDDVQVVDLNGQPVLNEKTGRALQMKDLLVPPEVSASADVGQRARQYKEGGFFSITRFFCPWSVQDKTIWHLTADGRLVAYDIATRRPAGMLAPPSPGGDGAADDSRFLLPQGYQGYRYRYLNSSMSPGVLASARNAYVVDLENRKLKPLFTVMNGDAIRGFAESVYPYYGSATNGSVLILTRTSILLLDPQGKTKVNVPYAPALPEYPTVTVFWLDPTNTFAVRFDPDYMLNKKSGGKLLSHVDWVNSDGSISNAMTLPKLPELIENSRVDRLLIPFVPPAFPVWNWDEPYRVWNLLRLLPAALSVGVGWWLGRRNNFTPKAQGAWGIFHLLFGLPGFLAFLAVQEWPVRESCLGCKQSRTMDRERCEHCGANFPPPETTGTEIFEPLT